MPPDMRRTLEDSLATLGRLLQENPQAGLDVLRSVKHLVDPLVEPMTNVVVVGPVNVGKSSLYNALAPADQQAATSPVPGTTRDVQHADLGLFRLVDTPGADRAGSEAAQERDRALTAARQADFLVLAFDATRGVLASDRELYDELTALGKKVLVVLNKIDLVEPRHRPAVLAAAAQALQLQPHEVIATSATRGTGTERLVLELAAAEPRLLAHLGRVMVPMRRKLAWQAIRRSAITSMLVALTPIPMLDLIPLTAIQVSLVLTVSKIYGRPMSAARAMEAMGTFGVGVLARTIFYELTKLGGLPGWILSSSVAGSATVAIGYSAIVLCETGSRPKKQQLKAVTKQLQSRFTDLLRSFGKRKPKKAQLTQLLEESFPGVTEDLEETPPVADFNRVQ